jgi:hypothetical protein
MNSFRKRLNLSIVFATVVGVAVIFALLGSSTSDLPHPAPPSGATNVYFYEFNAWQTWNYAYRFDAPAKVCERFAAELMQRQWFQPGTCTIKTNPFTGFPIKSHLPTWFDVVSVTNGVLLSGSDWIYAVVDQDRGRLYYFNSH